MPVWMSWILKPADFSTRIFQEENVIFTPHAAFYSEDDMVELRRRSAENVTNYLTGDRSKVNYVVKPD